MPKRLYVCELCEKEFSDWDECWAHEEGHIKPDVYGVKTMNYLSYNCSCCGEDPRPYPLDISVPMTNGALVRYTFDRVITTAPTENNDDMPSYVPEATNE